MPRRSEKRSPARTALLDAAVDVLVDSGLSRFSVAAVASRAGVSTGALFYNYPNRSELLAAMAQHLLEKLESEFVIGSVRGLDDPADRAAALVDAVWALYGDPRMRAALELYAASRTDPELGRVLATVDASRAEHNLKLAETLIGVPVTDRRHLVTVVYLVLYTIQGITMDRLTGREPEATDALLALLRSQARGLVASA